jgi:hypothetical protein
MSPTTAVEGANRENRVLRDLVAMYHHLTGLALQSADLNSVVELLTHRTGALVAVLSPTLDVIAGRLRAHQPLGRVLGTATPARRALRLPGLDGAPSLVVAPIVVGDDIVAWLAAEEDGMAGGGEDLGLLVTEHAATICAVILGRERIVAAAAGRARADLAEGLLLGRADSPDELQRWAQHLGYDSSRDHRVISLVLEPPAEDESRQRLFASLEHVAASPARHAIVTTRQHEMVIVAREPGAKDLAEACLAIARRAFSALSVSAGLGGRCRQPEEISRAYGQARRAVEAAQRLGRVGEVTAFEDLGIHRLLLQVPELGELREFADEVLGELVEHERRHQAGYVNTLAVYFRENGSLQRAARQLHIHPNTVTYRLNRVEALTGLELGRYHDRLLAQVALEILDALEGLTAPPPVHIGPGGPSDTSGKSDTVRHGTPGGVR